MIFLGVGFNLPRPGNPRDCWLTLGRRASGWVFCLLLSWSVLAVGLGDVYCVHAWVTRVLGWHVQAMPDETGAGHVARESDHTIAADQDK